MRKMKNLNITVYDYEDEYDDHVQFTGGNTEDDISFYAKDLTDCPEDATLDRDLFSVYDYVEAIKLGIELGKKGYDNITYNVINELPTK